VHPRQNAQEVVVRKVADRRVGVSGRCTHVAEVVADVGRGALLDQRRLGPRLVPEPLREIVAADVQEHGVVPRRGQGPATVLGHRRRPGVLVGGGDQGDPHEKSIPGRRESMRVIAPSVVT